MMSTRIFCMGTAFGFVMGCALPSFAQQGNGGLDCRDPANADDLACIAASADGTDTLAEALGLPTDTVITNFVPIGLGALGIGGAAAAFAGGGGTNGTTSTTSTTSTTN